MRGGGGRWLVLPNELFLTLLVKQQLITHTHTLFHSTRSGPDVLAVDQPKDLCESKGEFPRLSRIELKPKSQKTFFFLVCAGVLYTCSLERSSSNSEAYIPGFLGVLMEGDFWGLHGIGGTTQETVPQESGSIPRNTHTHMFSC